MIRLEEGPPYTCPCCGSEDVDSIGNCDRCLDCEECKSRADEAAYDRFVASFYGSSSPVTSRERHESAWREKKAVSR